MASIKSINADASQPGPQSTPFRDAQGRIRILRIVLVVLSMISNVLISPATSQ